MRALLAIGTLLALAFAGVHVHAIEDWLGDRAFCKMPCAGTDDCCSKKRREIRVRGLIRNDGGHTVAEPPPDRCCPDDCGAATASSRNPSPKIAAHCEVAVPTQPGVRHANDGACALQRPSVSSTRPRAPPAEVPTI